jgi:membrane-bound lytic murein transglycosylase F
MRPRFVSLLSLSLLLAALAPGAVRAQVADTQATDSVRSKPGRGVERASKERLKQKQRQRYDPYFKKYSKRYFGVGFDWRLFKAQGMAESELNPNAKSFVGARGIMQLMPSTYQGIQTVRPEFKAINDPEWNIAAGIMHDRYLWTLYQKDISDDERHHFMFASYNAGEGTINRAISMARAKDVGPPVWSNVEQIAPTVGRWRYTETLGYVRRIDSAYARLRTFP